jgi:hypothetical protein
MSGKPMRGVSTPGSVNAKSTTQSGRIGKASWISNRSGDRRGADRTCGSWSMPAY